MKPIKPKRCKVCHNEFIPSLTTQKVCDWQCAIKLSQEQEAKKQRKQHTKAKRELKDNDRSFQIKKTQKIFNKYIRLRDFSEVCISCGRGDLDIEYSGVGGKWDCGHYKTRGAFPELRFEPINAHKQCKRCNGGSGNYSRKDRTVMEEYGIGLLAKIGQEKFDWLNGPHDAKKYTIEELKEIQELYKRKIKELSC